MNRFSMPDMEYMTLAKFSIGQPVYQKEWPQPFRVIARYRDAANQWKYSLRDISGLQRDSVPEELLSEFKMEKDKMRIIFKHLNHKEHTNV